QRPAQRVDHSADHGVADRNRQDAPRAADFAALGQARGLAEQYRADLIFLQVHGDARDAFAEVEQLAGHCRLVAPEAGDAVDERDDRADLGDLYGALVVFDLLANQLGDFACAYLGHDLGAPCNRTRMLSDANTRRRRPW